MWSEARSIEHRPWSSWPSSGWSRRFICSRRSWSRSRWRLVLACLLAPLRPCSAACSRRADGAAVVLFLLTVLLGLYVASLTAESLVQAANTLPSDVERLAGQLSRRITDMIRDQPYLRLVLPEPGTIDLLGDANRTLLIDHLSYGLADLSLRMAQGLVGADPGALPAGRERHADPQVDPVLRGHTGRRGRRGQMPWRA